MSQKNPSLDGAGSGLDRYRHVCVLYHSADEELQVPRRFISEGFSHGDRAFHIIDETRRADHLRRLQGLGIDVLTAEESGQLEVRGWEDAHLRPGWFDQHAMLDLVEGVLSDTNDDHRRYCPRKPLPGIRPTSCCASWASATRRFPLLEVRTVGRLSRAGFRWTARESRPTKV